MTIPIQSATPPSGGFSKVQELVTANSEGQALLQKGEHMLLGNELSACYLNLYGGMETEKFLQIIDGSIRSFQIIGALMTAYALFGRKTREA